MMFCNCNMEEKNSYILYVFKILDEIKERPVRIKDQNKKAGF